MTDMIAENNLKMAFFGLILLAVAFEVLADVLFKKWSIEGKNLFLIIGLALYLVGTAFWAFSLKNEFLSRAVSVFTVLNFIAVVLAGTLYFGEELSTINKAGIALGILSIIMMEL